MNIDLIVVILRSKIGLNDHCFTKKSALQVSKCTISNRSTCLDGKYTVFKSFSCAYYYVNCCSLRRLEDMLITGRIKPIYLATLLHPLPYTV
jgi:hypothetical protein